MPTRLVAQNTRVGYHASAAPILHDFSAQIVPGTLTGVVGPNGSGKSTLVRALSRVLRPQSGAILLDGPNGARDLYRHASARASALAVSVVPQSANVEHEFSVREIVAMGRAPHISPRPFTFPSAGDEAAVENALAAAGVSHLSARPAFALSGGEWQRVLLARALAQNTDILLLDEPTAHLDLRHQSDVLTLARSLAHEGNKAVLAVLHDLNLAAAFCDRLLMLQEGRVVADGPPADVLTPARIADVYGADVFMTSHPVTGRPVVLGLPAAEQEDAHRARKVHASIHVVCGAGTGRAVLRILAQAGHAVTAGALPLSDTDAECAAALFLPCATETPFAPVSLAVREETRAMMTRADAIVVTAVPFGPANLANLELCAEQSAQGKRVFLVGSPDFAARDFTQGEASRLFAQLCDGGAVVVSDAAALLKAVSH